MSELSDLEFRILDEVYFVSSYETILENVGVDKDLFQAGLVGLLEKDLITQMKYNQSLKDFEKFEIPDISLITTSCFVATRKGLLIHNSRN